MPGALLNAPALLQLRVLLSFWTLLNFRRPENSQTENSQTKNSENIDVLAPVIALSFQQRDR